MSKWNALLAAILLTATMSIANAQQGAAESAATDTSSMDEDQARMGEGDDTNWSWLGLLGLAGLLGLKKRDQDDGSVRRDATAR